ncbi:dihydroxy-acid dehydratase [Candidatus Fermentibacteria bacterium]|nr:dihydroxy-acid dehydratase [Candidatus Fermentibacteria bacterium]
MVRMHPLTSKDPLIAHPLPLPSLVASVEYTLRNAKVIATREDIIGKLMKGRNRIAVVTGTPDDPAHVLDCAMARAAACAVWEKGCLPFSVMLPTVPQGVAIGHTGMRYDLVSRNITTALVVAQIEAYGFDAAISITSGEMRPVAELGAYVEIDTQRKNAKRPPFSALFLPPPLVAERPIPKEIRDRLRVIRDKTDRPLLRSQLDALMAQRLRTNVYPMFYKLLEQLNARKLMSRNERDEMLLSLAQALCDRPTAPACMENTGTNRVVLYGLGLIPSGYELLVKQPNDAAVSHALGPFLKAVSTRKAQLGAAELVEANLDNAIRLWSTLNGSTDWSLHFSYLASFMDLPEERQPTTTFISAICSETPSFAMFPPDGEPTLHGWAAEIAAKRAGGFDTVLRALRQVDATQVKDGPTVDVPWNDRLSAAQEPDGVFVQSSPAKECSGIVELRGNFCESSVTRISSLSPEELDRFDKKTYLAVFYYNEEDAVADLFESSEILDKVKTIVTMDDLLSLFSLNYPDRLDDYKLYAKLKKDELFDRLVDDELMRIFVVIAGEGPVAGGMRQIYYPAEYLQRDVRLRNITVLCTDGRIAGTSWGPFIGHCAPEGMEGGGIAAIETGELVYVDFENGIMNALDKDSSFDLGKIVLLSKNEIQRRPLGAMRQRKMAEDRLALPLSLRSLLNSVTPTTSGAAPFLGR